MLRIGYKKGRIWYKQLVIKRFNLYKYLDIVAFFLLEDKYISDNKRCFYRGIAEDYIERKPELISLIYIIDNKYFLVFPK